MLRLVRRSDAAPEGVIAPAACANRGGDEFERWQSIVTNGESKTRSEFASRGAGAAVHAACSVECGVGIYDELFSADEVLEMRTLATAWPVHSAVPTFNSKPWQRRTKHVEALAVERVRQRIEEQFALLPDALRLYTSRFDRGLRGLEPCAMHSDFDTETHYVYTAIVYLSDYGRDFSGGETVFVRGVDGVLAGNAAAAAGVAAPLPPAHARRARFVDAASGGDVRPMVSGVVVQPAAGRVALFSAGSESLHCKMPSTTATKTGSTQRAVLQLWFHCADPSRASESHPGSVAGMKRMWAERAAAAKERVAELRGHSEL
jgi:hypothetical protein